ncbi:MAG TPA: M23 family metallopeptidase [Flavisolibacter sp.]
MKYSISGLIFSLVLSLAASGQNYPRNYFRNPLNIPLQLVGNFGELRTNHWHMGLDIRTQQRENLPVFAAAEGYVSRVVVEPGGFGQAIYITHPNGYTTLYAHMNAFYPVLSRYVYDQQYQLESWRVSLEIPKGKFPVKKGEYIGRSGNTGGSQGPHVHFEIRDAQSDKVLNPLLFGFPVADAVPPAVTRLAMYERNKSTYEQSPQLLALRRSGRDYVVPDIRVGTSQVSFAIGAVDRFSGFANPNGIYRARVSMDGNPVSEFILDRIDYNETRYMNAHIDYPYQKRGGAALQHLSPLPGAMGVPYAVHNGDGIIRLDDGERHDIVIDVWDANKNHTAIRFGIRKDQSLATTTPIQEEKFIPGHVNIFERDNFELFTTEKTMYDSVRLQYSESAGAAGAVSGAHTFLGPHIPVHDSVTVRIRPAIPLTAEQAARVIIRCTSGSRTYVQRARWHKGWLVATFRQFGTWQAFLDTEPATVNAPPTNLSRASSIRLTPVDNFKTIRSFRAELDGRWLRFSNDKGRTWVYHFDEKFPRGRHELKVTIEDEAGNVTVRTWQVTR